MALAATRKSFLASDVAAILKAELTTMVESAEFNTGSAEQELLFIDKHMNYVSRFSYIDPRQYVMNLKMKSRK